jgi:23S rRNA (pseudouridine1915-N3)-methyltransferase
VRIIIAAVGRLRDGPSKAMFESYADRLIWPLAVREVELKRAMPVQQARAEEARLLLDAAGLGEAGSGVVLVALDERGHDWPSAEFAQRIARWRDDGAAELAFAIGGADGHGQAVLDRAAARIAFGRMTWPHRLARIMLIEQIYRAQQIMAGHPYHRE